MSERGEAYQAGMKVVRDVSCECGNPLWREVIEESPDGPARIYLILAGVEIAHFSGTCGGCGRRLEWHCNQVRLERLVERIVR